MAPHARTRLTHAPVRRTELMMSRGSGAGRRRVEPNRSDEDRRRHEADEHPICTGAKVSTLGKDAGDHQKARQRHRGLIAGAAQLAGLPAAGAPVHGARSAVGASHRAGVTRTGLMAARSALVPNAVRRATIRRDQRRPRGNLEREPDPGKRSQVSTAELHHGGRHPTIAHPPRHGKRLRRESSVRRWPCRCRARS